MKLTLNDLFVSSCKKHANRPFLSMAMKRPFTYAEVEEKVEKLAGALFSIGVKKKDKIAILAENSPNWGIAYLAVIRLGAIVVPILPDFPDENSR